MLRLGGWKKGQNQCFNNCYAGPRNWTNFWTAHAFVVKDRIVCSGRHLSQSDWRKLHGGALHETYNTLDFLWLNHGEIDRWVTWQVWVRKEMHTKFWSGNLRREFEKHKSRWKDNTKTNHKAYIYIITWAQLVQFRAGKRSGFFANE